MHIDIKRAYLHAPSKEEKYVQLPSEMWRSEYPEYGRMRVSQYGVRDAAANWDDACAKVLTEQRFIRGSWKSMFILLRRTWVQGCHAWRRFLVWSHQTATVLVRKSCGQTLQSEAHCDWRIKKFLRSLMLNRRISWRSCGTFVRAGHELSMH